MIQATQDEANVRGVKRDEDSHMCYIVFWSVKDPLDGPIMPGLKAGKRMDPGSPLQFNAYSKVM